MTPTPRALHGLALLCALLFLTSCGAKRTVVRAEAHEIPKPYFVDLPAALTQPEPEPAPPTPECRWPNGKAVLCNEQGQQLIDALRAWGARLNGKLVEIGVLEGKAKGSK